MIIRPIVRSLCAGAMVLAASIVFIAPGVASPPPDQHRAPRAPALPEGLSALSWVVADATTGDVLASRAPHMHLPPASTLKTLFALTVLPKLPAEKLHTVVPADLAGLGAGSSQVGVEEGSAYRVADLWRGVFLRSGGDAVHVLAAMNGGVQKTIADMRQRAAQLGADDTRVMSPDGYDAPGQYSSAYDLALFGRAGLADPAFAQYCSTAVASFPGGVESDGRVGSSFEIQNTNRLLTGTKDVDPYPGLIGIKNGYTTLAGNTLIAAAHRGNRTLIVTVMNPQAGSVYEEARSLLDWGFAADDKVQPVGALRPAGVNPAVLHPANAKPTAEAAPQPAQAPPVGGTSHSGAREGFMSPINLAAVGALLISLVGSLWLLRRRMRR
ncbi:D-alanyl-D-alanine carboxypeptidase [Streptomyces sp. NPDC051320]|uniref:D-alanyl-D-alanine carboxypeptidase family protein n=1 Tax=Streptomyces sp. NPDC051320 TaxID=3154644 RepID=UPI0034497489